MICLKYAAPVVINHYLETFEDRYFIAEDLENIEKHPEEKYEYSIKSTQRFICTLCKDIKRIGLKSPKENISLEKSVGF